MGKKIIKYFAVVLMIMFFASGCGIGYQNMTDAAYSNLKIRMTKGELDNLFRNVKFLKEQTISKYPNISDSSMRDSLLKDSYYGDLYPKNVFENINLDGNIKVLSYLIRKQLNWPNGWLVDYIVVFYDKKSDKVIGWGKIKSYDESSTWEDNF